MPADPVTGPVLTTSSRRPAAEPRRLGHPQMAFVRAWAEGVDLAQAWQRYLGQGPAPDGRRVRAELQGLLDMLRSTARVHGRGDVAALLRRDPASMAETAARAPSLDDFRAQQPEDFYSEAELLELYTATHGAPDARSGTRRRQRLRTRQLAALQWLETVAVREPQPADALASWLDERLAARLATVGLTRLDQLQAWIGSRGFHWHRTIPRVGAATAARVLHWLQQHARTLGPLPAWALVPPGRLDRAALMSRPLGRAAVAPAAVGGRPLPLERLVHLRLPPGLTGSTGHHRAPLAPGREGAALPEDDLAALHAWLAQRQPGSATWRAYRKEGERLLLWALWVAGKPVSSLDAADLTAYQAFLAAPPAGWTAPRGTPRWHDDWRPFEGPLSDRSAAMALGIVRGMLDAWVAQGYLSVNPWTVDSRTGSSRTLAPAARLRALTGAHQAAMAQWMEQRVRTQGSTPALLRLQALWAMTRGTGLRPAELVAARLGWLRMRVAMPGHDQDACHDKTGWWLDVPANATAGNARSVALDDSARDALHRYLAVRGLAAGPAETPITTADAPLFAQLRSEAPLSPARLYELMTQALAACADDLAQRDPEAAATLRQASTHWLRHGYGLQAAVAGARVPELQQCMGHRSRASSAGYRRAARTARAAAAED